MTEPKPIKVDICGHCFQIKADPAEAPLVESAAALVNKKMSELQGLHKQTMIPTHQLVFMAAFQIAYELCESRGKSDLSKDMTSIPDFSNRLDSLIQKVKQALQVND